MHRKPWAEIDSEFDVWIWKVHYLSISSDRWAFDCVETEVRFKNLKIVVICILPFGPFNYHIKGKWKFLSQFLIDLTLSISIRGFKTTPKSATQEMRKRSWSIAYSTSWTYQECTASLMSFFTCRDMSLTRTDNNWCFWYTGNWELVKSIVGTKFRRSLVCSHSQAENRLCQLVAWLVAWLCSSSFCYNNFFTKTGTVHEIKYYRLSKNTETQQDNTKENAS